MLRNYPARGWLGLAMLIAAVAIVQTYYGVRHVLHAALPIEPQTAGLATQGLALALLVCGFVLTAQAYRQVVWRRRGE